LSASHQVIVCDFGYPGLIDLAEHFSAFITAYSYSPEMLKLVPQVIFGALPAKGQLPFTVSANIKEGAGIETSFLKRFAYTVPEDAQMDGETLVGIETIANEAISTGATPGCHVLVARNGKVIYERSFGYLTYENKTPVTDETIYDLASVTKVSATLQAVMFLYEKGMIDINKKASSYLPELKRSNKSDFTLKDILTHQAGLWPFLPFWSQTIKDNQFIPEFYSKTRSDRYPLMVADSLYSPLSIRDSLWTWIIKSKVREKAARTPFDYRYSDMGFYILQHLAEKLLNQPIEDFIQQNLYEPLGASTTGYLPLQRFLFTQIAPTENDKLFRKSLLIGNVHDQGAAMLGGVAGHAGLFSNANDLAKLGQMLLQEGIYGGIQYYKPETVRTFTQKQFVTSHRGLGWDRPTGAPNGSTSLNASQKTFGHTGFTGTCIWVDPEFNLVYVFLSNRVHPDMTNNKLINTNVRPRIHDVIYQSIFKYCQKHIN
jgi:CubicO group peptidase (beta-lactamase class C family)